MFRIILRKCIYAFALLFIMSCQDQKQAKWIGLSGDASQPNKWVCFRKTLVLSDRPDKQIAQVAVDSKYWLWINDSLVIRSGGLTRNVNPYDTYFDEVDLTPYLKKGKNVIAVLVNYFGRNGLNHNSSGSLGLYFNSDLVYSDDSWKASVHPAFYSPEESYPNFRFAEQNIGYDAQLANQWFATQFDDSMWENAIEKGLPPAPPWNKLVKRPIPLHKDYGLKSYSRVERKGDTVIACLPYDAHVNPYFKIKTDSNPKIQIFSDTYALGNLRHTQSLRAEYMAREGIQEFEMPHWISGHKIYYIIPANVEILELKYRESGYNTSFAGRFFCNDQFLNTLWKKSQRTLYVSMHDYYMDCPDRERSQYAGDVANMMNQSFFAFDTAVYSLNEKSLRSVISWQRKDSTLFMPYGGWFSEELPLQMLHLTGFSGIYQYFLYSGDTATIRDLFPSIKKYHALWKPESSGLYKQRKGDWYWRDWGNNIDERLLDNVLYANALKSDILFSSLLGYNEEANEFSHQYKQLKDAINKEYWNGKEYRSKEYDGPADDRGNALAIISGIADSSKYEAITKILKENYFASTYLERFVLEALFIMQKPELAIERMKKRFAEMVDAPYSTLWEQWDYQNPKESTASYNHGWSGSPLHLLPQKLAGIEPTKPGFAEYTISPQLLNLSQINCQVSTLKGMIDLKIDFEDWQFLMELYSPPGTLATVGIPKKYYHSVFKINGSIIRNNLGRKNRMVEHIRIKGEDADYIYCELQPGKWLVELF